MLEQKILRLLDFFEANLFTLVVTYGLVVLLFVFFAPYVLKFMMKRLEKTFKG